MPFTFPIAFFGGIVTALRAISDAVTGTSPGTPANPSYAYDTTGTTVDISTGTICTLSTTGNKTTVQTFSFASGSSSGTLHINMASVTTVNNVSFDTINTTNSSVDVAYSIDSGTNWIALASWAGGMVGADFDCTAVLSVQNMSNLRARITAQSFSIGAGASHAASSVSYGVSDVVVL